MHGCEIASEKFFEVFYEKMFLAEKILKSLSSTINTPQEELNDLDELLFTPKSVYPSPHLTPIPVDRQISLVPPLDETFVLDADEQKRRTSVVPSPFPPIDDFPAEPVVASSALNVTPMSTTNSLDTFDLL